jgi:transcription elongation factor SPT4
MSRRPHKDLRACLLCSIVLTLREFSDSGCPNCQDLMSSAHDGTTSNWEGSIALIDPNESWVSKWQGLTNYVPGLYAVRYRSLSAFHTDCRVNGTLPEEVRDELERRGIPYRPRDGSSKEIDS